MPQKIKETFKRFTGILARYKSGQVHGL